MTDPWIITLIVAALGAFILGALTLSLDEFSRTRLEQRWTRSGRETQLEWLMTQREELRTATSLWHGVMAVLFVLALFIVFQPGADEEARLISVVVPVVIALVVVPLHIGLSRAIAEHAATPLISICYPLLRLLLPIATPILMPIRILDEIVRRLVGADGSEDDLEDELRQVMEESEREGQIDPVQMEMFEALVDFPTMDVDAIMTPRIDVIGIEIDQDLEAIKGVVQESGHSRYPVYDGDLDHIEGILYVKDLLKFVGTAPGTFNLRSMLREIMLVPESRKIRDVLTDFQRDKVHMALVLDEYGGTSGIVTIEDIVEEVFGEIVDEHDPETEVEPVVVFNDDGTVEADARVRIDEFNDEVGVELPEDGDYDTIGGWVFASLGRIPDEGEELELEGMIVQVVNAAKTHIEKLRFVLPKPVGGGRNGSGNGGSGDETAAES